MLRCLGTADKRLYMAPEILRFEKYDATADLWSVGAVLFEMAAGRPPFRASNHVELLRRIDKADDNIKFPDEASKAEWDPPPIPVPDDIKALIRGLLKRHAKQRMSFEDFFNSTVWDGYLAQSRTTEDGTLSVDVSTDSSSGGLGSSGLEEDQLRHLVERNAKTQADKAVPARAPQPLSTDPALNPEPARAPAQDQTRTPTPQRPPLPQNASHPPSQPIRRTQPKYYVQSDAPPAAAPPVSSPTAPAPSAEAAQTGPRPIRPSNTRRVTGGESPSLDEPPLVTPTSTHAPPVLRVRNPNGGSPLAATPPITMGATGKDSSALEAEDSITAKDYVVVEKRTVEINALADGALLMNRAGHWTNHADKAEVDQASRRPSSVLRRHSTRPSVVTRPVPSFQPSSYTVSPQPGNVTSASPGRHAIVPASYSPPLGMSSTPPFALAPVSRQVQPTAPVQLSRPPSIQQGLNVFPPPQLYDAPPRLSSSPSSLQTSALARALTNTALRLIGHSANVATNAFAKATAGSQRRPSIMRTGEMDPDEEKLLTKVEDLARKGFVLFELADSKLVLWHQLASSSAAAASNPSAHRRKSSSSSISSEILILRQQERIAGEAVVLFCKALAFIVQGTNAIQRYWESKATMVYETSAELNERE